MLLANKTSLNLFETCLVFQHQPAIMPSLYLFYSCYSVTPYGVFPGLLDHFISVLYVQSLFFFRFSEGSTRARGRRATKPRVTLQSCVVIFVSRTFRQTDFTEKKRDLLVVVFRSRNAQVAWNNEAQGPLNKVLLLEIIVLSGSLHRTCMEDEFLRSGAKVFMKIHHVKPQRSLVINGHQLSQIKTMLRFMLGTS